MSVEVFKESMLLFLSIQVIWHELSWKFLWMDHLFTVSNPRAGCIKTGEVAEFSTLALKKSA